MMMTQDARLIKMGVPIGYYCYTQLEPIYETAPDGTRYVYGHMIKYCPFWYGFRPNGGCMIFGWDAGLGDACKSCGWLEPTEVRF